MVAQPAFGRLPWIGAFRRRGAFRAGFWFVDQVLDDATKPANATSLS
jgi:hypothetical protein